MDADSQHLEEYRTLLQILELRDPEYHYKNSRNLTSTPREALNYRKKIILERIHALEKSKLK